MSKWVKLLSREGVDLTTISQIDIDFYDIIWQATGNKKKEVFFTILKDKNLTHYINADVKKVGEYAYQKFFNHRKQILKYYQNGKKILKNIKKETSGWLKKLTPESTDNEFLNAFNDFRKSFEEICYIYSIVSWFAIESWQIDFENILKVMISRNNLNNQMDVILSTAYKPWKKTALVEIQQKIAQGDTPQNLVQEYQFLRNWSVVWYKPITEEWFKSFQAANKKEKSKRYSLRKLVALLKPNRKEFKFLQLAPYAIFFKDWRDDLRRFHVYSWSFFFDVLAERFKVPRDEIGYLTLNEIENILRNKFFDYEIINQRKNGCVITVMKNKLAMRVLDGGVPEKYFKIINQIKQQGQEKIIQGKIAQIGIARGVVRIIRSCHDIKRVQDGDILVANTTHSNYLLAMAKASAFVTNEGGIACHAAIVARELKKPCIVGTKNATEILKDGDMVEVDAGRGIVKLFLPSVLE